MKKIILLLLLMIPLVTAQNWVIDPNSCPSLDGAEYPGQDCTPEDICGDDGGIAKCYDTSTITAPAANATTYSTNNLADDDGGYSIDCYIPIVTSAPYCFNDGLACERNETFHGSPVNRNTICLGTDSGNTFGDSYIGTCKTEGTDYWDCFGDTNCESTSSSDCDSSSNNHYITATCNTDASGGAAGTCECDTNYFACDSDIEDADGCEHLAGSNCGDSTGDKVDDQCFSAAAANCTNYITGNSDCDDDDSDGNLNTCNAGNYCEITNGGACGNSTGTYVASQCEGVGGNCTRTTDLLDCNDDDGDGNVITCNNQTGDGCEVNPGSACTIGGLPGTVDDACPYNCAVANQDIATTGIEVLWSGSNPMLWLTQLGAGPIINLTYVGAVNVSFVVNSSGAYFNNVLLGGGSTAYPHNQDLNTTDDVIFNSVNSADWSNVSITESQINDLDHTTDTNITYYADEDWINKNSTDAFEFNESKLATIYYNATQSAAIEGTIDGGTFADTQHQDGGYDGTTFNFSEVAGSPGLDFRINFTEVPDFSNGVIRYKTSSLAGDFPVIQLWNYDDSVWEDYPALAESESFATITQPVFDSSDHITGEVVQMRLYKATNGNINNHYYVDWVAVSKGFGTPAGEEVDPYWEADKSNYYNKSEVDTNLSNYILITELPLENKTISHCSNITGEDVCTDDDTTYTNGSGISLIGTEFNHTDTSTQSSSDNSGFTYIQDIVLDTYGHITSIVTSTFDFSSIWAAILGNRTESETALRSDLQGNITETKTELRVDIDSNYTDLDGQIDAVNVTANIEALGFTQGSHTPLTNVAFTNKTNVFVPNQNFTNNVTVLDRLCIGGSSTCFFNNGTDLLWSV